MQHKITPDVLKSLVPSLSLAKRTLYAPLIEAACLEFEITNYLRVSAFLAQTAEESDHFRTFTEYASGAAYDHRADLGNTRPEAIRIARAHNSTPGRFWKGHGAIQDTGFDNHKEAGEALGLDLVNDPGLAALPENAFRVAGYFWKKHNLNALADARKFVRITEIINGGHNGLTERLNLYHEALKALPDDFMLDAASAAVTDDDEGDYSAEDLKPVASVAETSATPAKDSPASEADTDGQPKTETPTAINAASVPVATIPPVPPAAPEPVDASLTGRASRLATQVKAWQVAIPSGAMTFGVAVYKWATDPTHEALILATLGIAGAIVVVFVIMNFRHSAMKARIDDDAAKRAHELELLRETHAFELTKLQAETAADPNAQTIKFVTPDATASA